MYGGLDVGTTKAKCGIYDTRGRLYAQAEETYPRCAAPHHISAEAVWSAVKSVISRAAGALPHGEGLTAFAVSAFGETIVPVGPDGEALCEPFLGSAEEGAAQLQAFREALPEERFYRMTGLRYGIKLSGVRLGWYGAHTDYLDRAARWMLMEDFVIYKLTGEAVVSHSSAARSMLFDLPGRRWSPALAGLVGVDPAKLSRPEASGRYVGPVAGHVARELGLGRNVKVFTGGHDQMCSAFGSGILAPDTGFLCSGTVECVGALMPAGGDTAQRYHSGVQLSPYYGSGELLFSFWAPVAGCASLDWFVRMLQAGGQGAKDLRHAHERLQGNCRPGPVRVMCFPYFMGRNYPDYAPAYGGAFVGMDLYTEGAELYQSILESAAFEDRLCLERYRACGVPVRKLRAVGGGANSAVWTQMKATILGMEIETIEQKQAGTLGCMMMAATACGEYRDPEEAVRACVRVDRRWIPDAAPAADYEEKFTRYRALRQDGCLSAPGSDRRRREE